MTKRAVFDAALRLAALDADDAHGRTIFTIGSGGYGKDRQQQQVQQRFGKPAQKRLLSRQMSLPLGVLVTSERIGYIWQWSMVQIQRLSMNQLLEK